MARPCDATKTTEPGMTVGTTRTRTMAERTIPDIATLREICHRGKLAKDRRSWYAASRSVAIYITWMLIHTGITANQVTFLTVSLALAGAILLATPPAWLALTGAALLLAYHLLDKVDGDVRSEDTRLNSSHLGISYAVFCLKKKKK